MVGADTHGSTILLTYFDQRQKTLPDTLQLFGVGSVGIVDDFKFLFVRIVARIDAHFLYNFGCQFSGIRREVNVRY